MQKKKINRNKNKINSLDGSYRMIWNVDTRARNWQFAVEISIVTVISVALLVLVMREGLKNEKVAKMGECLGSDRRLSWGTNELLQRMYEYYFTKRTKGINFVFSPVGLYRAMLNLGFGANGPTLVELEQGLNLPCDIRYDLIHVSKGTQLDILL